MIVQKPFKVNFETILSNKFKNEFYLGLRLLGGQHYFFILKILAYFRISMYTRIFD
jgi:hypothetical protein